MRRWWRRVWIAKTANFVTWCILLPQVARLFPLHKWYVWLVFGRNTRVRKTTTTVRLERRGRSDQHIVLTVSIIAIICALFHNIRCG